jgi:hypothetical protein
MGRVSPGTTVAGA